MTIPNKKLTSKENDYLEIQFQNQVDVLSDTNREISLLKEAVSDLEKNLTDEKIINILEGIEALNELRIERINQSYNRLKRIEKNGDA